MTNLVDKFCVKLGLDTEEIQDSPHRGLLYIGIVFMLGMTTAFFIMAALS